ncbi:MAG: M1 family metallopeptidase [Balneolaceae bacterium]
MKLNFRVFLFCFLTLCICYLPKVKAQPADRQQEFSRQDTLRGSITPERAWWDLTYYHLDVAVDIAARSISGSNAIYYRVLEPHQTMQIDLQKPLEITRITQNGNELDFEREGSAFFVTLEDEQRKDDIYEVVVEYSGEPKIAVRPPWDGGFTWDQDSSGKPFVATSNQGIGASVWWPNKDHPYDEPDSMLISVNTPDSLMDVSNGRLRGVDEHDNNTKTWHWYVDNPINNYGVNINIADYVHFGEEFEGEAGTLTLDYYVLRENEEKAREQFKQVIPMMEAFEHWFGPYPFYDDGYKLVEAPYLGMEHQSSVTYGNGYQNGYLGRDPSGSGWGLEFDFIIIHETGHEWFANNITYSDVADMWIHEGFTNYSENLYLDYHFGETASSEYVRGIRPGIQNDRPITGTYGVNHRGSGDMYNKGGNMLHTIRQVVNDDELWRETLRGLNREFYHQTVTAAQVEQYITEKTETDLAPVFDQYVRDIRIPVLEYAFRDGEFRYRWGNVVEGFNMPVDVTVNGEEMRLEPGPGWQAIPAEGTGSNEFTVDPDYYVGSMDLLGE